MAKNQERAKMNQVREKITKQYSTKLKAKDARIQELLSENEALRAQNRELKARVDEFEQDRASTQEWLERMQDYVNLSDEEMEEVRKSLASSRESREERQMALGLFGALTKMAAGLPYM